MKKSTLFALALSAQIGAIHARATQEPPLMTSREKLGALVELCPGFIEASIQLIIGNDKPAEFQRWEAKNEFDGPWRAQLEKQEVDRVRSRFGKDFSADKQYRITTWLFLGPYDFKASQFPLFQDVLAPMPPPYKGMDPSWSERKADIGQELYLSLFNNQSDSGNLTGRVGLATAPPKALVIKLPVGMAGQSSGLVPCASGHGICLLASESEARNLADPSLNPSRLVQIAMDVKFDACTRKMDASFTDNDYVIQAKPVYVAAQAARRHPRNAILSAISRPESPKGIYDDYSVEETFWEWTIPSSK